MIDNDCEILMKFKKKNNNDIASQRRDLLQIIDDDTIFSHEFSFFTGKEINVKSTRNEINITQRESNNKLYIVCC